MHVTSANAVGTSVCIVSAAPAEGTPTVVDYDVVQSYEVDTILRSSLAFAFLVSGDSFAQESPECAVLSVSVGNDLTRLPDGSVAVSRPALQQANDARELVARTHGDATAGRRPRLSRFVPLRLKEKVNRLANRVVFDLSWYLQFQPSAIDGGRAVHHVPYRRERTDRKRVVFITPHLGIGGAERVLLQIAGALNPASYEITVVGTHSAEDAWRQKWRHIGARIYDLGRFIPPEKVPDALYSLVVNAAADYVVVQNTLFGYSILPNLRTALPDARIVDVIHAVDPKWDVASSTRSVLGSLDLRVAISGHAAAKLREVGTPQERIRTIPNGVDLVKFAPVPLRTGPPWTLLFAGRLDAVKRPLLVADIAEELRRIRGAPDFKILVAGDGSEMSRLEHRVRSRELSAVVEMLGHVSDMAPVYARSDALIITSSQEGIPLVVLEAMACGLPIVTTRVGAIEEVADENSAVLIDGADPTVFAAALDGLMNDADRRAALGRAAREVAVRSLDIAANAERYRELFED